MNKIKVGIVGYGNLGKGVELATSVASDIECVGVFTRREPSTVKTVTNLPVYSMEDMKNFVGKVDVMIVCGGSATDLPKQSPEILKDFNVVDSFDTHAKVPTHFANMDEVGKQANHLGGISIGWDPGLFSIARMMFGAFLPDGKDYTFWGKGVSQGHSDAIRRIEGVKNAIQYTIPVQKAVESVRNMEYPELTTRDKHIRECFVVANEGADKSRIEKEIKEMPNYFADYDTIVHFVSEEELKANHSKLAHGGFVMRTGKTSEQNSHLIELAIKLDSNPEFTGSILTAYARAVAKLNKEGMCGCVTVFDIPLKYLSPMSEEELRSHLL